MQAIEIHPQNTRTYLFSIAHAIPTDIQGPILLLWINFIPTIDKSNIPGTAMNLNTWLYETNHTIKVLNGFLISLSVLGYFSG